MSRLGGANWPKEYGGRGATFIEQVIFQQELGRLGLPMGINVLGIIMTGPALMQWGTEEQKKRYLKPIIEADEIWCEGMSEPGAGSDLASIQTRAELHGDEFIVNGQKVWTTNAQRSDFCQLFVRTDPDVPKHKGMSALLVDMKAPAWRCGRSSRSPATANSTRFSSKTCECRRRTCSVRSTWDGRCWSPP